MEAGAFFEDEAEVEGECIAGVVQAVDCYWVRENSVVRTGGREEL